MRKLLAVLAGLTLCAQGAWAGGVGACDAPYLFRDAQANLIFIQYGSDLPRGTDQPLRRTLNQLGTQMAWLSKLTSWSLPNYQSLGIVSLVSDHEVECDQRRIAQDLISWDGIDNQVLVMQHGRFALDDGRKEVLLQSYVSAMRVRREGGRHPIVESIPFALGSDPVVAKLRLTMRQAAAQTLQIEGLQAWAEHFKLSDYVYDAPDLGSPKTSLNLLNQDNLENRAYTVLDRIDDEWLAVRLAEMSGTKYLYISRQAVAAVLDRLPEMYFVNATLGLMRQIQSPDNYGEFKERVDAVVNAYAERASHRPSVAYLYALKGVAAFRAGHGQDAIEHLYAAAAMAPASIEFKQLLAAALSNAPKTSKESWASLYPLLIDTFSASPSNVTTLAMMEGLSEFAGSSRRNATLLGLTRAQVAKLGGQEFAKAQESIHKSGAEVYRELAEIYGESEDGCFTIDGLLECTNF